MIFGSLNSSDNALLEKEVNGISTITLKRRRAEVDSPQGFLEWLDSLSGVLLAVAQILIVLGYAIKEIIRNVRSMSNTRAAYWQ